VSKLRRFCLLLSALAGAGSCAGEGPEAAAPPVCPAVLGITITPGAVTLSVGDTARFIAKVLTYGGRPCTAIEVDGPFQWSAGDPAIASVHPDSGRAIAKAAGQTTVIVRWLNDKNFVAGSQVTVTR
jgi:uncharacterized protein YjdB